MKYSAQEIVKIQRDFFNKQTTKDIEYRKNALIRLEANIIKYEKEIYNALDKDLKKCEFEAYTTEVGGVLREVRLAIKNIDSWTKPKRISTPIHLMPARSFVVSEPYGVTLIISPFNYPFSLIMKPLIGALAAGNTAFLRPSEAALHTADVVEKIISESFDDEFVIVIRGDSTVTEKLLKERFDYIFFTGGVTVGKIIMKAAAEFLTPVTLELGGKSPAIVTESADIKNAANRIIWGKYLNVGQTCIAPDYVLVHKSVSKDFLDNSKKSIHDFYGGNIQKNNEYGRIINLKQYQRIEKLLEIEKDKIVHGGETDSNEKFISPTIIYPVNFEDKIMGDEIFGPILPIIEYSSLDDIITTLNNREKPLALYLFTRDQNVEARVLKEISFGGGGINETMIHYVNENLPFGGVGNSGMGTYHGKHSFDTFSHKKSILKRIGGFTIDLMNPPYKNKLDIIKRFLR